MGRIILFGMLGFMLMGVSKCPTGKFMAPEYEDCKILTQWDNTLKVDTATLFCIDERINEEYYTTTFIPRVLNMYNEHPLRPSIELYLLTNKDFIIKNKEYELPISYGRGNSTLNPTDELMLTKWAEDNRMERIKCKFNPKNY